MKNQKLKNYLSLASNSTIFILMFAGIINILVTSSDRSAWLKYYTNLSNVFLGIACAINIPFNIKTVIKNEIINNKIANLAKYFATITTTITFLVVIFFLGPVGGYKPLFTGYPSIIFHSVCPIIAIISLLLFDNNIKIDFKYTLYALTFTICYGIFYCIWIFTGHRDFYSFNKFGPGGLVGITIGILGANFGLAYLYRYICNKFINQDEKK